MNSDRDPFSALVRALNAQPVGDDAHVSKIARVDSGRAERTGVPEVVMAEGKDDNALVEIVDALLRSNGRAIVSRIDSERVTGVAARLTTAVEVEHPFPGRTWVLTTGDSEPPRLGGTIAVFTAGTSDLPVAGEAATIAREMGCRVRVVADVGVAGLHRLVAPLRDAMREGVDAIIVAAGMDGALPSVISGLVDVPVIGLPTSVGYGVAAGGHAALNTMLATCAPGMAVVNIDNGVGAGATAARIALRAAAARSAYAQTDAG